jgi:hypothetical protein
VKRRVRVERLKLQSLGTTRTVALVALLLVLGGTANALASIDLGRPAPALKGEGFRVLGQTAPTGAAAIRADVHRALGTWALAAFVAFSLGLLACAIERQHRTLAASLLGVPRRRELLAAKVGAVVPYALAIALAALALDVALTGSWLRQNDVSTGIGAGEWARIVLGGLTGTALAATAGVAVGVFVTAPATGIVGGLAAILVAEPVLASRSEALAQWLPGHALDACFAGFASFATSDVLPQGIGLAALAGWTLLATALAVATLDRRDVV